MGNLMLKELVKQIEFVGESQLPLRLDEELLCWANLHGWNVVEAQGQRLLVRQALLNIIIRQLVPDVIPHAFATPLDTLDLEVPPALTQAVYDTMQRSYTMFNFWGDLYCSLIPQSQRRRIGQFWTNEQITDWMISWLLQFKPRHLFDVGCGAGNFLLRARQHQDGNNRTKLSGLDISPLLLNTTLATFLTQPKNNNLEALPYLLAQDYFAVELPDDTDAIICNPPYTRHHHIAP
jgi:hypothetical protein